jgi:hypothetical protein
MSLLLLQRQLYASRHLEDVRKVGGGNLQLAPVIPFTNICFTKQPVVTHGLFL